eukprot:CAMPEP_0172942518 /NCGR_PEP_ID=MMETSP1075-20121228/225087_1 /TAXON_ID=2916 /ORGANISM="Ceratium fusus, Strain PA161109" /LENGTH=85 /DNA_ID=CAMNT_0013803941 /DNA_START=15 /DNA_END=272 /DNA_ORIENTATION=+
MTEADVGVKAISNHQNPGRLEACFLQQLQDHIRRWLPHNTRLAAARLFDCWNERACLRHEVACWVPVANIRVCAKQKTICTTTLE